ncbi:uncharacterized protein [Ranitomeya imitator]|uniref:uncharacterized protein n=1 Tax=Ranitomeya imitator TaxID=111125 RepID=UPI0037E7AFF1
MRAHKTPPLQSPGAVGRGTPGMSTTSSASTRRYPIRYNRRRYEHNRGPRERKQNGKVRYEETNIPGTSSKVINLSKIPLSSDHISVLSLGLSFSPASRFDRFSVTKDLQLFARKLTFKKMFHQQEDVSMTATISDTQVLETLEDLARESESGKGNGEYPSHLLPKSTKFPQTSTYPEIDLFIRMVMRDLEDIPKTIKRDNLTKGERTALKELEDRKDVVIKPSDKGGNVVIWPVELYEKEMYRQINNIVCYRRLTFNPMSKFRSELKELLSKAVNDGILTCKQMEGLLINEPNVAVIYLLPKVHKDPVSPPGRGPSAQIHGTWIWQDEFMSSIHKSSSKQSMSFIEK